MPIMGLLNNYTYAIGIDPRGFVWVGHRMGLSRIHAEKETIRKYGRESGFDSDILRNSVATTENGKILLGYHRGSDPI